MVHRDERERGKFDSNLNFVFEKNNVEVDAWVAELDEATMERGIGEAAFALRRRKELQAQKDKKVEEERFEGSFLELILQLLCAMQPGETLVRTMRRVKSEEMAKKKKETESHVKGKGLISREKSRIDFLTDLADQLISHGVTGIYDLVYEALVAMISLWEYQAMDGLIHGPFPFTTIKAWRDEGYFTGNNAVMMRRVLDIDQSRKSLINEGEKEAEEACSGGGSDEEQEEVDKKKRSKKSQEVHSHPSRKRVRFEDRALNGSAITASKVVNSGTQDLMADLEDDEDEGEEAKEEEGKKKKESDASSEAKTNIEGNNGVNPLHARVMALAVQSGCFDVSGRGEWVLSEDIPDFESVISAGSNLKFTA